MSLRNILKKKDGKNQSWRFFKGINVVLQLCVEKE